ncbi:MAG: DUF402 domain-containing protein [Dehalococcoidia bacterium]|nr:DUF402 domain-containing protein [Dehalococcoidia bacterium]
MNPRDPIGPHRVTDRVVRILSTKFDGSLHNDFVGRLIEEPTGRGVGAPLRVFVPEGTSIQSYRGDLTVRMSFTALFWPDTDRWWNVYHNHWIVRPPGGRSSTAVYANVSTPATFDGETLRWVDLDLDVVIRDDAVALLDEDEFEEHRARMAYPEALAARAREAASLLLDLAARRAPPFDRDSHVWPRSG